MRAQRGRLAAAIATFHRPSRRERRWLTVVLVGLLVLTGLMIYQNANRGADGAKPESAEEQAANAEDQPLTNAFPARPSYSRTYHVSPDGQDTNDGRTADRPLLSVNKALSFAAGGDTVELADGDYWQSVASAKSGSEQAPITIRGSRKAVIRGTSGLARVVELRHSHIALEGFTIDGQSGAGTSAGDFRNKLLYVQGSGNRQGVEGLKVRRMLIQNAGGECVRLRYFARNNEISDSEIKHCGVYDFRFGGSGKNGEGIYIGTAPEQLDDGRNPTDDPDISTFNIIRNNRIETHGNECVDIKEGATGNVVESNHCQRQMDPESAGFDARGDNNTFRYNTSENNEGAGFRLGGDRETDGINNNVYNNVIRNNKGGAVKVVRTPQARICGNTLEGNAGKNRHKQYQAEALCNN